MIDEELTELSSFTIDLQKDKSIEINHAEVNKLIDAGFKNVTVKVYGSSRQASGNLGNDEKLFENIKKVQSLPDTVIYDFLNSKGSLIDSDLWKRIN